MTQFERPCIGHHPQSQLMQEHFQLKILNIPKVGQGQKHCNFLEKVFVKCGKNFQILHKNLDRFGIIMPVHLHMRKK